MAAVHQVGIAECDEINLPSNYIYVAKLVKLTKKTGCLLRYSLHMQKTSGMKAPMATKMGSMAVESSFSYGSRALGPLGLRG